MKLKQMHPIRSMPTTLLYLFHFTHLPTKLPSRLVTIHTSQLPTHSEV